MSSTSQPTTFLDLYTDLRNRSREASETATVEQAKRYINIALGDMHVGQGEKFPWAERSAVLVTQPKYTTGTLSVAQGLKLVAGTSTDFTGTNDYQVANVRVGGKLVVSGVDEVYEVASVASAGVLSLASIYLGDTDATASYVYFEDEYALHPDFLRPIDQQKFDEGISIDLVGRTEFRRRYPRNRTPGKSRVATLIEKAFQAASTGSITAFADASNEQTTVSSAAHGMSNGDKIIISGTTSYNGGFTISSVAAGTFVINATWVADDGTGTWTRTSSRDRRIRFAPPPDTAEMIRYAYVTSNLAVTSAGVEMPNMSADTDEPIVPLHYRHAIVLHALARWYRDKQDDQRSVQVMNEYTGLMLSIISDTEIGGARAQFRPRVGQYRRRAKRPWGGGTGRYDINGRFDRFE